MGDDMKIVLSFVTGLIFGIGLIVSGMSDPVKVMGFLDWFGEWDPTLLYVMVGAILTVSIGYVLILKRPKPILTNEFQVPKNKTINKRLIGGSAVFGLGWGMSGYCPGPAAVNISFNPTDALVFLFFMIAGFYVAKTLLSSTTK